MTQGRILIVDDEENQRLLLRGAVEPLGFEVQEAQDGVEGLEKLRFQQFDIMITDMQMPRMSGVELVEQAIHHNSTTSMIVVTAHGTIETAVDAMKKGAEDYLLKPIELSELEITLQRIMEKRALARENRLLQSENQLLRRELGIRYHAADIIGRTPKTQQLMEQVREYSQNQRVLLLLGEPGTGKDDLARMIHYNGPWADRNLVFFDCIEVPAELHETHLYGQEMTLRDGVRTPSTPGLVERAQQGTLVISNIHRLEKKAQASLVRVLQEQKAQRTQGSKFYPVNLRIIATSEREPFSVAVDSKELRFDLHGLLQANRIEVPPLRDRRDDIPLFIAALARKAGLALGKKIEKINRDAVERLVSYDFPGNIRELSAMVEAAVIRSSGPELKAEHFRFPV